MGGPQLRILAVAEALRARGIETAVALPDGPAPFASYLQHQGFTVYRTPLSRLRASLSPTLQSDVLRRLPGGLQSLVRIVRTFAADIVHIHGLYQAPAAMVGWLTDRPLVWHLNDLLLPPALVRLLAPGIVRVAQAALPVSQAVRRYLFDGLDERGRVTTVYDPPVRVDPAQPLHLPPRPPGEPARLLNVANLYRVKGQAELIDALARLPVPAHLTLAGAALDTQPEVAQGLHEQCRTLKLEHRVTFSGWQEDVARLYERCDLYVHPSHSEACPLAVLEAMAAGRAVVATSVGGVPELVVDGHTGLLVPPHDPARLAAAITQLLQDDGARTLAGEAGRARVLAHFSLKHCADRHESVYRAVLTGQTVG